MNEKQKYPFYIISLDIGGTKISGALVLYENKSTAPKIVFRQKIPSEGKSGIDVFESNIYRIIGEVKAEAEKSSDGIPLLGLGIGSAGRIDKNKGSVTAATEAIVGYAGFELCKCVSEKFNLRTFVLNDVQAHTLGEARWGAGKNSKNFILLAIGTGIGGAAVVDGKLMLGNHGFAGELGHVQSCLATGIPCACGKSGHLESVASGTGIELSYEKLTNIKLSGQEISKLAKEEDKNAIVAIELAGRSLGQIIAMYQSIFDPEKIVLCGSVSKSGKLWKDAVMTGYKEEVIGEIFENLNLCDAELGDSAALIGAAEYVLDRLEENE